MLTACRFWLVMGCRAPGKHIQYGSQRVSLPPTCSLCQGHLSSAWARVGTFQTLFELGEWGMCWYPPGQTVRLCFLARLTMGSLWALMRKKCPGDRFSPSHRSKAKPPSRAPVESTELSTCGAQRRCSSPLTYQGFGVGTPRGGTVSPSPWGSAGGLGHLSPALPWCMKRMRPLSIWAWVNLWTSVPGADLSTTFPLAGGWME